MEDFQMTLYDRLEMIRSVLQSVPDDKAYISFSGGKDSTVLSHLIDEAIPNNRIKRVFCNTGIEHHMIVDFVKRERERDDRIEIITPDKNIRKMLEEDGYPYKSKLHSELLERYQRTGADIMTVQKYLSNDVRGRYSCPKQLKYQFSSDFNLKVSAKCCLRLKKQPFKKYVKEHDISMTITGVRANEGGIREYQAGTKGCVFKDKHGGIMRFNPLSPCTDEFMEWYINERNIELCELYYPPYDFRRTGCVGCPYNINVRKDLDMMKELMPAEYKQACIIWKPVYDEMARTNYRKMRGYDSDEEEVVPKKKKKRKRKKPEPKHENVQFGLFGEYVEEDE